MTREPFRLGGSPVNNIKGMKKYLFAAGKLDFPEFRLYCCLCFLERF